MKLNKLKFKPKKETNQSLRNYRSIKRNTAFVLIYAVRRLRNSNTREIESEQLHFLLVSIPQALPATSHN